MINNHITGKRVVALLLAMFMCFSSIVPQTVFATTLEDAENNTATVESVGVAELRNSSRAATPSWVTDAINGASAELSAPGSVKAFVPIIEEDASIANKWTVKMLVAARDIVSTSRIVLVIDTSGSMKEQGRLTKAKEAANAFIDKVLDGSDNTQIAIVRFSGNAETKVNFTNNKSTLKSAVASLYADGGTFTQEGVHKASQLLNSVTANKKYMVVLSDGLPTYSYEIYDPNQFADERVNNIEYSTPTSLAPVSGGRGLATNANVPESGYKYSRTVGTGHAMYHRYHKALFFGDDKFYNHGNSAIAEAGFAKNNNIRMFTVGLQTDSTGSGVLKKMASTQADFTEVTNVDDLVPVFETIAGQILKTVNEATVNIQFNTGFQLHEDFDTNTAECSPGSQLTLVDGKPKWEMATVSTVFDESDPSLKYEYITYVVTINDDILENESPENGINPLGDINMTYTDSNGELKTETFPQTTVNPTLVVVKKAVRDNQGGAAVDSDKREFQICVEKPDSDVHEILQLRPNEAKIINNAVKGATYRVYEQKTAYVYDKNNTNPLPFDVDTYYSSCEVESSNYDNPEDVPADGFGKAMKAPISSDTSGSRLDITFTNVEEEEARAVISVRKIIEQGVEPAAASVMGNSRRSLDFKINLKRENDVIPGLEQEHDYTCTVGANETVTIPHKMRFTTYIVTEKNTDEISPYYPKVGEQGKKVKINLYDVVSGLQNGSTLGQVVDFTNVYNVGDNTTVTATKKWIGGSENDHKSARLKLYRDGEEVEGVLPSISTIEGEHPTYMYEWTVPAVDATTNLPYDYTVKEAGVSDDNTVTFNNNTYKMTQEGNNITNAYVVPSDGTFQATKVWKDIDSNDGADYPTVTFTLHRKYSKADSATAQATEVDEMVPGAAVIDIDKDNTIASWENLETTTASGEAYTFYVVESFKTSDVKNDNWELGEFDSSNNSITNRLLSGSETNATLKITKHLNNVAPEPEEEAESLSYRSAKSEPLKFEFRVTGPYGYEKTFKLEANETKTLENLRFGEYKVEETDSHSFVTEYQPDENGQVILTKENLTAHVNVFNFNDGDDAVNAKIKVTKLWVGGPEKVRATIELHRRNNLGEGAQNDLNQYVTGYLFERGEEDTFTFTMDDDGVLLPKYDEWGNLFEYYVLEPNPPANYKVSIEGTTVTNTFIQPEEEVVAIKKWADVPDNITKPEVKFELWRKVGNGEEEKVVNATSLTENNTVSFGKQPVLDGNGDSYTYFVKEVFEDESEAENWAVTGEETLEITNTFKGKIGKITVKKILINEPRGEFRLFRSAKSEPLEFGFKVTGPDGYEKEFTLEANETKTLENLAFGKYTIIETQTHGYEPDSLDGYKVELTFENYEQTITVINSNIGHDDTVVKPEIEKIWVGGDKPDTVIQLWRKGSNADGTGIDEYVNEHTFNAKVTRYTFETDKDGKKLAKHDPTGREFEYYAKEPKVPEHYIVKYNGLMVTNTYYEPEKPIVPKDKDIAEYVPPVLNTKDHYAYIVGYPDGTFGPGRVITRAEMTAIFARLLEERNVYAPFEAKFNDVHAGQWYTSYILTLSKLGVITGYPDGSFKPNQPVTRGEFASIASRFIDNKKDSRGFKDINEEHWAKKDIEAVLAEGWINGYPDGTFRPELPITRAEVVTIVNEMLNRRADQTFVDANAYKMTTFKDMTPAHWAYYKVMEACNGHEYERVGEKGERWIEYRPDWLFR